MSDAAEFGLVSERLKDTPLAAARLQRVLGQGRRSVVYLIRWQGQALAMKVYSEEALNKHFSRHPVPMARYEYQANRRVYQVPGIESFVARPVAFLDKGGLQAFVQEHVEGVLFEDFRLSADESVVRELAASLRGIVKRAHAAGVFDLDLHPNNVMVVPDPDAGHRLMLFDFNNIPVHERSPNPLSALLMALNLIRPESRDLRRLHLFTDPPGRNRFGTRRQ